MTLGEHIKQLKSVGYQDLKCVGKDTFRMIRLPSHPNATPTYKKKGYIQHNYITKTKCIVCKKDIWIKRGNKDRKYGSVCEIWGDCWCKLHSYAQRKAINSGQFELIYTQENPGTDNNGYLYWRESTRDKNDKPVRTRYYVHRVVAENMIGRPLKEYEHIHHIDMNKKNNNPSNLWVCSASQHKLAHWSFNTFCAEAMVRAIQFDFDKNKGEYYIKEAA